MRIGLGGTVVETSVKGIVKELEEAYSVGSGAKGIPEVDVILSRAESMTGNGKTLFGNKEVIST